MTTSQRLLIVDDSDDFRDELANQLTRREGFEVVAAATAAAGLEAAGKGGFDLLVLDVGLPDMDGRELCRRLRADGIKAPIIMLTALADDADAIQGLDAGANDYVAKPVRLSLLTARIRAQLRQFELSDDAVFQIGPYSFHPATKMLTTAAGKKIRLTEKETGILKYLYRTGDRPVPRERLLGEVWGYNAAVSTHTLETHIYRLRQKIEPAGGANRILLTEPGGYKLARSG